MNKKYSFGPISLIIFTAAVLISLAAVFSFAQAELAEGVTQEQFDGALSDLSEIYGQAVTTQEQAKEICNLDKYAIDCAEIGREHDLFPAERIEQVNTILDEIKGQVADQIKSCPDIECLVGVAQGLATKISRENPTLALQIDLTPTIVREKKEIVEIAKSAGLTIDQCIEMDPDTASVELLRGCARLSKENKVRKYVPTEARAKIDSIADSTERTVQLKQALSGGQYQCGDGTIDGCGNFCLNPGTEARAEGASAIPSVCKEIATKFFGSQGARELENAYSRVSGVADYYYKKAQNFVFTTLDGRTLTDSAQIGKYMEEQGRAGNVEAVSKGMDFMIAQGFATQADKDFATKMIGKFREKGGVSDFDVCVQDPKACKDFIHEDFQSSFNVMDQVFEIMRQEIGFSPDLCEQGQFDQSIGLKCLEGGKRALPKIEVLASQYPEVRFIVEEIRSHLLRGDQLAQKKDQFTRGTFAGPGGCREERECFVYCSNPANGPECIAFGAKQGLSGFTGDQAVQKYQQYEYTLKRPAIEEEYVTKGLPPYGDVIYPPGYQPPFYGGQPGQPPYGQPYGQPYGPTGYPPSYPLGGDHGPSPECLRAITSGDFVTAKRVCDVGIGGPGPGPGEPFPYPLAPVCPLSPYFECPAGQYHESFRNRDGCFIDGPCKPIPTYSPGPYPTYSPGPYPTYSPGPYPTGPYPTQPGPGVKPQCSDGIDNDNDGATDYPADTSCYGLDDFDEYYPPPGVSPGPTYSPGPGGSTCSKSLISLLGDGCHQMYTDSSGQQIYCDGPMTKSAKEGDTATTSGCYGVGGPGPYPTYSPYPSPGVCPAGYHWHGEQGGFCINDQENYSGICYSADGKIQIKCPSQPTGQCIQPQWWDPAKGYCVGSTTSPSPVPSTCPAGYHYHGESGGFCMNDREDYAGTCYTADGKSITTCPKPTYPSPQTCPSGQWWDYARNACVSSTATYTPAPSCPSGQWWDSSISACKSITPYDTAYPVPSYTPYSGYCGDAVCSSSETSSSCPSDCGGGTATTYTPYPSPNAVCGNAICEGAETSATCPGDCGGAVYSPTPYPTTTTEYIPPPTYSPPPSCPTGQFWDEATHICKTASLFNHQLAIHCAQLGREWNGKFCQPEGFIARIAENTWAALGKLIGF